MIKLLQGDCLKRMAEIPDKSIDMVLADPPYGTTACKWDSIIPLEPMWEHLKRVIKPNGAIVMTASQPFTTTLIASNMKMFKYDLIWEKTIASGQLNVNRQPLRKHESVLIFYARQPIYNQQFIEGRPYSISRKAAFEGPSYGKQTTSTKVNTGYRHPTSIIRTPNPRIKGGHPAQKPVALMEYLIRTYTNKDETVLDFVMGSGTTGVACKHLGRNFIGIELDSHYFEIAKNRIASTGEPLFVL